MKMKFYGAVLLALLAGACSSPEDEVENELGDSSQEDISGGGNYGDTNDEDSNGSADGGSSEENVIDIFSNLSYDEMVYVEGGTFLMGTQKDNPLLPNYDEDAEYDEVPVHEVTLSSYYIGKYEVTQGLWEYVMNYRGTGVDGVQLSPVGPYFGEYKPSSEYGVGADYPVYWVNYDDIVNYFIPRLNKITGKKFRLPTEAEWEYAARGGQKDEYTRTHTSLTDPLGTASGTYYKYPGSNNLDAVAWYGDNSGGKTHPVGGKASNALGLYDMSGNVLERCSDWYDDYYSSDAQTNPQGPAYNNFNYRVLRGGCWYDCYAENFRVSYRDFNTPDGRGSHYGLRLALSL